MVYEIDQSGKIEDTARNTVIAFSNGSQRAVLIPKRLKRQIQEVFRLHGFTSLFIYYLFSVGIYYLLEKLDTPCNIHIDLEYPGKDILITAWVNALLRKTNKPFHHITFTRIGNHPKAHYAAKDVFDKKIPPNRIIDVKDIRRAIKKTDGRLRECLSTLVDAQPRSMNKEYHNKKRKTRKK